MPHCQTPPPHVYRIIMPPASKEKVIEIIRQKFNCNLDPVIRYFSNSAFLFPNEPFPPGLKLILLSCNKMKMLHPSAPCLPSSSHHTRCSHSPDCLPGPRIVLTPLLLLFYGFYPPTLSIYIHDSHLSLG